jgi:hypothetical protein
MNQNRPSLPASKTILSFNSQRGKNLMKSRFLASTIFLLLLGLFSTNLFGQITDASSVDFLIKSAVGDWRTWTSPDARQDTVGRETQWAVRFEAGLQDANLTTYTVIFPVGTITDTAALKSNVKMTFYDPSTASQTAVTLAASRVEVLAANEWANYSASVVPQVKVTADRSKSTYLRYTIAFTDGLRNPLTVASNTKNAAAAQQTMLVSFIHSDTEGGTYSDSSFFVTADKADKVVYNTSVQGFVDQSYWPSGDSIYVTDQWGNINPDFFTSNSDSLVISVAPTAGSFSAVDHPLDSSPYLYTTDDSNSVVLRGDASTPNSMARVVATWAALDSTPGTAHGIFYEKALPADSSDDAVIVYLGPWGTLPERVSGTGKAPGGIGVKFTVLADQDTVKFTMTIAGPNVATDSIIGVKPTNVTTMTRDVLGAGVGKEIGDITLTLASGPHYNAANLAGGIQLALKDVFGDPLPTTAGRIGVETDSVMFIFKYRRKGAINETMTTLLQDGGSVTSKYSRPATSLIGTNIVGNVLKGDSISTVTAGTSKVITAKYLGTTSEPVNDSIYVVAYAFNSPSVRDSALISVSPGPPVAWDLDTFAVNLKAANDAGKVIKGAQIPVELPIFALDTAYNRVTNMSLLTEDGFLDGVDVGSTASPINAINLLINGRDPLGYDDAATRDSIKIDSVSIAARNVTGYALTDPSFIFDYDYDRADKSKLNLGGAGDNPMGLRLLYQGINYKLSIVWDPGDLGGIYGAADWGERSADLGLFTLGSPSLIDSVETVVVESSADSAGIKTDLVFSFVLPVGNSLSPNLDDSVVSVAIRDLAGDPGIPADIGKDSVEFSDDGTNYYPALPLSATDEVGQVDDSITVVVPMEFDASSSAKTVWMKIHGFLNPTAVDTAGSGLYNISVSTDASPIQATTEADSNITIIPASYGKMKILPPGGDIPAAPYYLSQITQVSDTLTAGDSAAFHIVLGDRYDNIITGTGTLDLVFKGADTTITGVSTVVSQGSTESSGDGMYDTLTVSVGTIPGTSVVGVDSIIIVPALATSYYLVVMDSIITDSVMVTVVPTAADEIAVVEPKGTQVTSTETALDSTLKVNVSDVYGNLVDDAVVRFVVSTGLGTFVDSNGVAVAEANDTLSVVTVDGVATAGLMTGTTIGDIVVTADLPADSLIAAVTFSVSTESVVEPGESIVNLKLPPDSLVQDTSAGVVITADVSDAELVKEVYLRAIATALELDTETGLFSKAAVPDTVWPDTLIPATPDDSVRFTGTIPAQDLATEVVYDIKVVDNDDSVTWSDAGMYVIAPKAGKQDLTDEATTVSDLMRTVYLYLKPAGLTPRVIDYLGLDLDVTGDFEFGDILAVLDYWRGTSAALASATQQQDRSARVSLGYEAVDKANATLSINLENQGNLMIAGFRVKYDADEFVFGEAKLAERLKGFEVQFSNNETEGVYTVVVLNLKGGMITSGNGAVLSIPISAVGDKFDGEGEISLLSVDFERDVATDVDAGTLSPKAILPKAFALSQNYPNPFNPSTTIAFDIPEDKEAFVRLKVYNIRGQLVRTLVNETMVEGSHKIEWDGKDNNGRYVSSGVYFYRIQTGEFSKTRKMVILK